MNLVLCLKTVTRNRCKKFCASLWVRSRFPVRVQPLTMRGGELSSHLYKKPCIKKTIGNNHRQVNFALVCVIWLATLNLFLDGDMLGRRCRNSFLTNSMFTKAGFTVKTSVDLLNTQAPPLIMTNNVCIIPTRSR